ncbi:hypothetical protein DID88_000422 [Monilinia fructigena]|uniref:DNA 3'-5' helicase n=1 Tax=Monilinia fructigena TaxID=38457 RepID=A0A395IKA1_9HELO|nr:hypothetical protein DID88_000422 [Monilinia fructigena]
MISNSNNNSSDIGPNSENGQDQSFNTNFFTSKDSRHLPPETGFTFGPSPMQRRQQASKLGFVQGLNMRSPYDNIENNQSLGYLVAPSEEPPPAGFTFGPAPKQFGPSMVPPGQDTTVRASYNTPGHDPLAGYLSRPSFESPQLLQRLSQYPATNNGNGNSQGRLSLPRLPSLLTSHAESESFGGRKGPRVLTSADNHFKQQILQDIELKTKPKDRPAHFYNSGFGEANSPLTQLANNMISQTSLSLPQPVGPSPKQNFTPPSTRTINMSAFVYQPTECTNTAADSSPLDLPASSPSARVGYRRNSNRILSSSNTREAEQGFERQYATPHTPQNQTSSSKRYTLSSRTSQVQNTHRNTEHSGFSPAQETYHGGVRQFHNDRQIIAFGNGPPMAHGIQLVSPHELPDRFRQVFPYELFNAVQSKCFAPIYRTNNNIVVSAPTGSGKTALLELAICKLVENYGSGQFKIVYQAPVKSLCSERMRDWTKKFSHLNLPVAELTGDTSNAEMSRVGNASIIITTPEKWDSITRKWADYQKLLQLVKLFLIDEVHILKDVRGATLEAVVSRMHSIGVSVRFVALSATVPNSNDIATWLGRDSNNRQLPAHRENFGEEFRPVKTLDRQRVVDRAWPAPTIRTAVGTKDLQELVGCGVAYHHAGLDHQDRCAIETAYLKGYISVICCTSTLAVGVNLPCHLVVLKGTVGFQDSGLVEYSDLEVMQMLGRAGRPQFDDNAVAVIMTRMERVDRYKKMISGQDVLESTLHLNLIEHLNSEIGLRTIKTAYEAKVWLGGTFLSVRMRQNPSYYKFSGVIPSRNTDEQLELVCERDIKLLQDYDLVTKEEAFSCTEYGAAMSRYMPKLLAEHFRRLGNNQRSRSPAALGYTNATLPIWLGSIPSLTFMAELSSGTLLPFQTPDDEIILVEKQLATKVRKVGDLDISDEYYDGINDDAMLVAAGQIEGKRRVSSDYGSDAFVDIDTVHLDTSDKDKVGEDAQPEPLKNGKWQVGLKLARKKSLVEVPEIKSRKTKLEDKMNVAVTKFDMSNTQPSGSQKLPKLIKKPRLTLSAGPSSDQDAIEVIDLSRTLPPVTYPDVARRDYRKLHELHTNIQKDSSVRLSKNPPTFSYASGDFLQNNVFDFAAFNSEKAHIEQFSSPLMSDLHKKNDREKVEEDEIDSMDIGMPCMKRQQSSPWMRDFRNGNVTSYDHGDTFDEYGYDNSPVLPQIKEETN